MRFRSCWVKRDYIVAIAKYTQMPHISTIANDRTTAKQIQEVAYG